jgi:hypothetical protein
MLWEFELRMEFCADKGLEESEKTKVKLPRVKPRGVPVIVP